MFDLEFWPKRELVMLLTSEDFTLSEVLLN